MRGSDRFVFVAALVTSVLMGCHKNYYAQIMQDGTCTKDQYELTQACHDSIINHAPIDVVSFDGHQDVLDSLVRSIHMILAAPMKFPLDKKMFGQVTLQSAGMDDFIETFLSDPNVNFNEEFTNFVLNAATTIGYGCNDIEKGPYYTSDKIHICGATTDESVLLHEARHATAGWHNVHCSDDRGSNFSDFTYECDKGMDLVYGWVVALEWGLLQGEPQTHRSSPVEGLNANHFVSGMVSNLANVRLLPPSMNFLKDSSFLVGYASNFVAFEQLPFPSFVDSVSFQKLTETILNKALVSAQAGDFDGDGHQDLVFAFTDEVQVFLNQGSGNFLPASGFPLTIGCEVKTLLSMLTGDINHDGHVDAVVSCTNVNMGQNSQSTILFGKGDGTFASMTTQTQPPFEWNVDFAKLVETGKPELVSGLRKAANSVIDLYFGFPYHLMAELPVIEQILLFKLRDVNHDGVGEAVFVTSDSIQVFLGQGGTTFSTTPIVTPIPSIHQSWKIDDFDGDGNMDLLPNFVNLFCVTPFLGTGDGHFLSTRDDWCGAILPILINFPTSQGSIARLNVDLNGDHQVDLITTDSLGGTQIGFSRGSLEYRLVQMSEDSTNPTEVSFETEMSIVAVDFAGDAAPDLVFVNGILNSEHLDANRFSLFVNQGLSP